MGPLSTRDVRHLGLASERLLVHMDNSTDALAFMH